MSTNQFLVLSLFTVGLVFIAYAIPLMLKRVPPNRFFGFRAPQLFDSKEQWYTLNYHGGKAMLKAGLTMLIGCIFIIARSAEIPSQTMFYVALVFLLLPMFLVYFQVRKKLKEL